MSQLSRRIREREAAIEADRYDIAAAITGLRTGVRRRISSPGALYAAFGGGLVLGWVSGGGRSSSRGRAAPSSDSSAPRTESITARLAREVLWPVGIGALQLQLRQLLTGADTADTQRR